MGECKWNAVWKGSKLILYYKVLVLLFNLERAFPPSIRKVTNHPNQDTSEGEKIASHNYTQNRPTLGIPQAHQDADHPPGNRNVFPHEQRLTEKWKGWLTVPTLHYLRYIVLLGMNVQRFPAWGWKLLDVTSTRWLPSCQIVVRWRSSSKQP